MEYLKYMKRYTLLFCFSIIFSHIALGADQGDVSIRIAKYKGDKSCAISYTFDDGLAEHYTLLAPYLDKLGFKATFWINGSKINKDGSSIQDTTRMTWRQLKNLSDRGHEISNHGWAHKNHGRHTRAEIIEDINKNDSAIYASTGVMPRTFCYPNNTKTPEGVELASKNRVGTRTEQHSIGSKWTLEDLDKWVNTLLETNGWGVGMTHGITYGYDAFKAPSVLWDHLARVKAMEDSVWVATFHDVAAYVKERDSIKWKFERKGRNQILITPELSLDKDLFSEELTMVIEKKDIDKATVEQDGKQLQVNISLNKVFFDFNPHGGIIEVSF